MSILLGKVFISHSSKDKPFADKLVSDLASNNVPVWYDRLDIRLGDSIPGKINIGIAESKYFLIVLSPDAVKSNWVQEELNAALMRQIASAGTFLIPILLKDCDIPPLLSHRHYADFRKSYRDGLNQLLEVWGRDSRISEQVGNKPIFPWLDLDISDREFVYLHSTRFDKFFRMNCDMNWSVRHTIDYIASTLTLPWNKELSEFGMRWSFSYALVYEGKSISLSKTLNDVGISVGSTVQLRINGTYEDLYEKQLTSMWEPGKMYEITGKMIQEAKIREKIKERGTLTRNRLKDIADSCFAHV